jgi:hypothetical protein
VSEPWRDALDELRDSSLGRETLSISLDARAAAPAPAATPPTAPAATAAPVEPFLERDEMVLARRWTGSSSGRSYVVVIGGGEETYDRDGCETSLPGVSPFASDNDYMFRV